MHWIFAHLIGDYVIQNDWMAQGKKKSSFVCTVHVLTYIIPFLFCSLAWWQLIAIAIQHFIQDRTNIVLNWMNFYGQGAFAKAPLAPWSIIVVDNIWHILWIAFIVWLVACE